MEEKKFQLKKKALVVAVTDNWRWHWRKLSFSYTHSEFYCYQLRKLFPTLFEWEKKKPSIFFSTIFIPIRTSDYIDES